MRIEGGGWRIVEKADQWIDVEYDAGNFTASGGTTPSWTVDEADQVTFCYQIDGNKMTVAFQFHTTTTSGSPTTLSVGIPAGRTAARAIRNAISVIGGSGYQLGAAQVTAGGTTIDFLRLPITAWAGGANGTFVIGEISFMVRDDCASISENHVDQPHQDQVHGDSETISVPHEDVAFSDQHLDSPHTDASHGDTHGDTHDDVLHEDTPFADEHTDTHSDAHEDVAHGDDPGTHTDGHTDHSDLGHVDVHGDHSDGHADSVHEDDHTDTHADEHEDTAHEDTAFVDDHTDQHLDSGHQDTAHVDHQDVILHQDVAHADQPAVNTPHGDSDHQDVGFACNPSHVDQ